MKVTALARHGFNLACRRKFPGGNQPGPVLVDPTGINGQFAMGEGLFMQIAPDATTGLQH